MNYCHVSRQCDDYAHQVGMDEDKSEAIEALAGELMKLGGKYDPLETQNFREGLGEITDSDMAVISGLIRNGQYQLSAMLMEQHINAYWERIAQQEIMGVKQ